MLAGWCPYVLIGHSERRQIFHEPDQWINLKLRAAVRHGLKPILAVGETLEEHDAGQTDRVVTAQVTTALDGSHRDWADSLSVAYEPVWAIGTGRAATPGYANGVMARIRRLLREEFASAAAGIRVLYGGSVTADNAADLMAQPEIDGPWSAGQPEARRLYRHRGRRGRDGLAGLSVPGLLVLVVIDGWGYNPDPFGNAIAAARKPNWTASGALAAHHAGGRR